MQSLQKESIMKDTVSPKTGPDGNRHELRSEMMYTMWSATLVKLFHTHIFYQMIKAARAARKTFI